MRKWNLKLFKLFFKKKKRRLKPRRPQRRDRLGRHVWGAVGGVPRFTQSPGFNSSNLPNLPRDPWGLRPDKHRFYRLLTGKISRYEGLGRKVRGICNYIPRLLLFDNMRLSPLASDLNFGKDLHQISKNIITMHCIQKIRWYVLILNYIKFRLGAA